MWNASPFRETSTWACIDPTKHGGIFLNSSPASLSATKHNSDPWQATKDSGGLGLSSSSEFILTPEVGPLVTPTGIQGPLAQGAVGLLLGSQQSHVKRSSGFARCH